MRRLLLAGLMVLCAAPAVAQMPVVTSAGPAKVAVTIYRDPDRGENAIDRDDPRAFALIAETRVVDLPPGEVVVRFEGVASGIVPQSAILLGPPPRERNRDAALLSQKGLVDGFTGQAVILRRTDPATGKVTEERAIIRSAADRLVVTTPRGIEALYCSGLNQTLIYPGAPAGLSAKPVLSMTTKDQPGGRIEITLAYIATGFDWDATYIATLSEDGRAMQILSWLTMASADDTSFADATTSAVAGRINRSDDSQDDSGTRARQDAENLNRWAQCWPAGTTTDGLHGPMPPPPGIVAPMAMAMDGAGEIMVTAQMRMEKAAEVPLAVTAVSESLGDLKLYRIPVPVTVAARSQKQVAFLNVPRVKGRLVYRSRVWNGAPDDPQMLFRFTNRKADGLGEPLPQGHVVVFQNSDLGRHVVGETAMAPKTTGEEVELAFGEPANVTVESNTDREPKGHWQSVTATIRNANPFAVNYEVEFSTGSGWVYRNLPGRLVSKPGKRVWAVTIRPGGSVKLAYRVGEREAAE